MLNGVKVSACQMSRMMSMVLSQKEALLFQPGRRPPRNVNVVGSAESVDFEIMSLGYSHNTQRSLLIRRALTCVRYNIYFLTCK